MKHDRETAFDADIRRGQAGDVFHKQRVLSDREGMLAERLSIPARNAGKPMRDVIDLDVEWRRIDEVEASPGQHALPDARWGGTSVGHTLACCSQAFSAAAPVLG